MGSISRQLSHALWTNESTTAFTVNHIKTSEQRTVIQQYGDGDWYTGRWWVGCFIWYSEERPGRATAPPSQLLAVQNVTAHPSAASVPTVSMYNGTLLCRFNVPMNGLNWETGDRYIKVSSWLMVQWIYGSMVLCWRHAASDYLPRRTRAVLVEVGTWHQYGLRTCRCPAELNLSVWILFQWSCT